MDCRVGVFRDSLCWEEVVVIQNTNRIYFRHSEVLKVDL